MAKNQDDGRTKQPAPAIDNSDEEFGRRVRDYLEVVGDRAALMRATRIREREEHEAMKANPTRIPRKIDIIAERYEAMARFFPPSKPPPP